MNFLICQNIIKNFRERRRKSFTLVELLIVIAIIAILAAIIIPQFIEILGRARDSSIKATLDDLMIAMVIYEIDNETLLGFCATGAMTDARTAIVGTGIDKAAVICTETPDFAAVSSLLHRGAGVAWVIDSTGRVGLGASRRGLVGEWRFEGNADDTSGIASPNDGTLDLGIGGNTTPALAWVDGALSLDGVDDSVNIPSNFGLGKTNITIESWVNLDSVLESGTFVHIGIGVTGYGIGVGGTMWENDGNQIIMLYDRRAWIPTGKNFGTGWHHIVMVIGSDSRPSLYFDGTFIFSSTHSSIELPRHFTKIGVHGINYVDAVIDEVRIYNRALSAAEIKAQFEAGR